MRLLLLILVAAAVTGGAHAQFRANSQRTRFDSDEFDNDFDDLFDRRSRERNSIERDSFERFTFGRTNTNNNNNNVVFRDSLETDSFEIRRVNTNRNANNRNNFVLVRDSLERDSIEVRRPFGTNLNINTQRTSNNNNFRSQGFRRDSPESFEIQIPVRNAPPSNLNQNFAAPGFRRDSFESVEVRNPFVTAQRRNNNRNTNVNNNRNNNFGFRRDSDERDNSIEVRVPVTNPRTGAAAGFRTVSIETNSFEIGNRFGGSRRQNPTQSSPARPAARQPARFFRDSPEDISLEVVLANPFLDAATQAGRQRNTGTRRPGNNFGGRGSVLRFDSFEQNSLERDSLEDLLEDLTDDDADDRARARLALQRLGRLPGGTATPSRSSASANTSPFGQPLSATNPFGQNITPSNSRAAAAPRTTNTIGQTDHFGRPLTTTTNSGNPFGRPLTINNNANSRAVLNQEVTERLNAIIAANRIPTTNTRLSSNNNNVGRPLPTFNTNQASINNNNGRPLPTFNTNQASSSRNNNQGRTGSTSGSARFPPLPVSPFPQGLRTNNRVNSNTIAATSSNFNNNNNNRFNLNDDRFNLNNNPFLSRTPSNQNQNQRSRAQVTTTSTTTPRPFRPVTPIPSPSRHPPPPPAPTTRRPAPSTTTARPTPQPPRQSSSSFGGSGTPNPFHTAARLNNVVRSESDKPPANPFINSRTSPQSKKSSSSSSSSSSRNKVGTGPRKSIPAVVPMGFDWPGGNGYYFRMSTGNSKPIQYFISYDD